MTSARIFSSLLAAIIATGVPASFDPAWERLYVIGWVVAIALAVLVAVTKFVADEVHWNREINAVINTPADPRPALVATSPAMLVAADELAAK